MVGQAVHRLSVLNNPQSLSRHDGLRAATGSEPFLTWSVIEKESQPWFFFVVVCTRLLQVWIKWYHDYCSGVVETRVCR